MTCRDPKGKSARNYKKDRIAILREQTKVGDTQREAKRAVKAGRPAGTAHFFIDRAAIVVVWRRRAVSDKKGGPFVHDPPFSIGSIYS